jgi:thioesterase domain-containing protein
MTGRRLSYALERVSHHARQLPSRKPGERARYLLDKVRKATRVIGGLDEPALAHRHRQIFEAYPRAIASYRPQPYAGPLTLFVNEQWRRISPQLDWGNLVCGGLSVYGVPGSHTTYLVEHVRETGGRLAACLDEAQQRSLR